MAVNTLQIGDEDVDFVGKSAASNGFVWFSFESRERWRQWRSYEYYINGKGITQAGRKKSQLLHLTVLEVQEIFEDLVEPGPVNATTNGVYKVWIRKLDAHFRADDNVPYERHTFVTWRHCEENPPTSSWSA